MEPSHHCAYLYNRFGRPDKTQLRVREIQTRSYSTNRKGFDGNEDCGQMSAWYVLSALGFYPLDPVSGEYEIGSPLVRRARLKVGLPGSSAVLDIVVRGNVPAVHRVGRVSLNGRELSDGRVRHADLVRGGVMTFEMEEAPKPVLDVEFRRPVPRPAQLARIREGVEVYGIVHWGLNTYTDREWGFGDEDPARLNPKKFDADQIVGACKDGGLHGLIVVAKHHDGFCLWPTKTTEHNISKSPFRNGKGDYVKEMEKACRRHGLKFGVYVSPWDRNSALYGSERYVTDVFQRQIRELLSGDYGEIFEMWFDGANGGDGYYGGAREKRKIPAGYYRYETETFAMVRGLQPNVCIFNESDLADFRFGGNERGAVSPDSRSTGGHYDGVWENYCQWANTGLAEGTTFHPIEADFPLRPGWFYHAKERGRTKRGAYLMQRYLVAVGNAATLNIGISPNREGLLDDEDVNELREFGRLRRTFFANAVDPAKRPFNVVVLQEDVSRGELVDDWRLEVGGRTFASGKSIGIKRIRVFEAPVLGPCKLVVNGGKSDVPVRMNFYSVGSDLMEAVKTAGTESGETDTAKWMLKAHARCSEGRGH